MALARRSSSRGGADGYIWPGFVDALATLLMVIIFILMVFFLVQINLTQRVAGQDTTLNSLRQEIGELANLLNLERAANEGLTLNNQQLSLALDASAGEIDTLEGRISALEASLNAAALDKASLEDVLRAVTVRAETAETDRDQAIEAADRQQLMLQALEARLQELRAANNEQAAENAASQNEILALTQSLDALKQKLGQIQDLLDEKEREAAEAKVATVNLTKRLNEALSDKVLELQRFRSDFFGRLRSVLENRSDIKIIGDRFVFQSEVLFEQGSADIGLEGEKQLRDLSFALLDIADDLPTEIDWVLQVSGHTDSIPINTDRFRDNWDLSTERALSVVRYLALAGIDPNRLSAAGFGEYQPIDTGVSAESRARNRRIEMKLTNR